MKSRQKKNAIEICYTYSDGKAVVAERFISALTNQTYKYMISFSQNMYINKLK